MERPERTALSIFSAGVGVAVLGLAAALPFPDSPRVIWLIAFCAGVVAAFLATALLVYEYWRVARPKRLLSLIGAMVIVLVGLLCAAAYFWPISTSVVQYQKTSIVLPLGDGPNRRLD
jgi:hypothetical protein